MNPGLAGQCELRQRSRFLGLLDRPHRQQIAIGLCLSGMLENVTDCLGLTGLPSQDNTTVLFRCSTFQARSKLPERLVRLAGVAVCEPD